MRSVTSPASGGGKWVRPLRSRLNDRAPSDLQVAQAVRSWIDSVTPVDDRALTASMAGRLHEEVARVWPDARRWGVDVLLAATQPAHTEDCRWLPVIRKSMSDRVHGKSAPLPTITKAMTKLLGHPCNRCVKMVRDLARGRVDSGRQIRSERGAASGVVTRAGAPLHDIRDGRPCATCWSARSALRAGLQAGLTASVAASAPTVAAALALHTRTLAPTGHIRPVRPAVHNGVGRAERCGCDECRGSRILAWHEAERGGARRR